MDKLMGRPPFMDTAVDIRAGIPLEWRQELDKIARARDTTRAAIIREAIEMYMEAMTE